MNRSGIASRGGPDARVSSGQALAALGAATLQHETARARRHPLAEAVLVGPLRVARLKSPLHGWSLLLGVTSIRPQKVKCGPGYCQDFPGVILGTPRPSPGHFLPGPGPLQRAGKLRGISRLHVNRRLRGPMTTSPKNSLLPPGVRDRFPTADENPGTGGGGYPQKTPSWG